jgi:hypothetical protein
VQALGLLLEIGQHPVDAVIGPVHDRTVSAQASPGLWTTG